MAKKEKENTFLQKLLAFLVGSALGVWALYFIVKGIIALIGLF